MSYLSRFLSQARVNLLNTHRPTSLVFLNIPRQKPLIPINLAPYTSIRIKSVEKDDCEVGLGEYDAHSASLGRPLSPHLTIYAAELPFMMSFLHRMTGIMLTTYMYIVVAGSWWWSDINSFLDILAGFDHYIGEEYWEWGHNLVKMTVSFPIAYHAINGIRHLGWDFGKFLPLSQIYSTGYCVLIGTVLATVGLTFFL